MRFDMLLDLAKDKAAERMKEANLAQDLSAQEWNDTARMIGVAAIKFADLLNQAHVDYIFDIDQMTSFEGKTGPYILYQAVRIKSLLRKAGEINQTLPFQLQDGDRGLALLMTQLPEVFGNALKNYTPHVLCEYAHRLAQEFSSFYGNCHILSEADEGLKQSRLQLCRMALAQLTLLTSLMGIDIPERM
jgi:arginyl-tRNA synthetase